MTRQSIEALRADVARKRRLATRKISRLKQQKGVYVSGTSADPRRDASGERRATSRELRAYSRQLSKFLDRKTQYVGDSSGRPVPAEKWKQYKSQEAAYNDKVHRYFESVADVKLPNGETVREYMAKTTPDHRQAGNAAVNAPYDPTVRQPKNIASKESLDKLTESMKKRNSADYFAKQNQMSKAQFKQMVEVINEPALSDAVDSLTDKQFAVLWNYTGFATGVSIPYELMMKLLSDQEKPWHSEVSATSVRESYALAKWATTLKVGG